MSIFKKENRMVLITGIICVLIVVFAINYTYSFFAVEKTNNSVISGEVESMKLSVTVTRVAPTGDSKLIPQQEDVIELAVTGITGNCLDGNGNTVCHVYKITLTNEGSSSALVSGTLVLDNKNNSNLKWAQISGLTNPTLIGNKNLPSVTTFVTNDEYQAGASKDYYVVVWINETGSSQTDNGNYTGTVTFTTVDGNMAGSPANTTLASLNITPEDDELTTFTTTSKLDGTTGVYEAEDDLGTSYYFRGNVENNYVKYGQYTEDAYQIIQADSNGIWSYSYANACPDSYEMCTKIASAGDDMYWRIVRINGDGTIRLVYDGISAFANNATNKTVENNSIGYGKYNPLNNDNAYVGYMYGTTGSDNYTDTHANTNDSDLKKTIDAWYEKYIYGKYDSNIVDAIYCSDRTRVTDTTINSMFGATGEGFGTYVTTYGLYGRMTLTEERMPGSFTPTLKCEQQNDRFTKEDTVGGVAGNSVLEYPVGAITSDELAFAGGYWLLDEEYINDEMYLYNTYGFWTISPEDCGDGYVHVFVGGVGAINTGYLVNDNYGVRPSISLNSNALTQGLGTKGQPYTISS